MISNLVLAAASEPNSTSTQILLAVLGSGAFFAVVGAVITGLFSKRKLGAEATEIITKAASGVVTSIEADLKRQRATNEEDREEHRAEMAELVAAHSVERAEWAAEREMWRRVLQLHVAWDAVAILKLGELDVKLPPAPPLTPPGLEHTLLAE